MTQEEAVKSGKIWNENGVWKNRCSKCNVIRECSNKWNAYCGTKKLCSKCYSKGRPSIIFSGYEKSGLIFKDEILENTWNRRCVKCNKILKYTGRYSKMHVVANIDKPCMPCAKTGTIVSDETRLKMSKSGIGRKVSPETREKLRKANIGRKPVPITEDYLRKLREAAIRRVKERGVVRAYNIKACKFIDELNTKYGYHFQHALNGGEVELCGYFADGYDKERNLVFEYDESWHEKIFQKKKDLIRTKRLIEFTKCNILRYSEIFDKFYISYSSHSYPLPKDVNKDIITESCNISSNYCSLISSTSGKA